MDVKRLTEIEYYDSLRHDVLADIQRERVIKRNKVQEILQNKVPGNIESSLTADENRLLRVYKTRPNILSDGEKMKAQDILHRMQYVRAGGCFNISEDKMACMMSNQDLMTINVPGVMYKICFSIIESFEKGQVNDEFRLVDAIIHLDGETYHYPLDQDEYEMFMGQAIIAGIDVENRGKYIPKSYKDLEEVMDHLRSK